MNTKIVLILSVALLVLITAHSRPSQRDLSKVDFVAECTTSSDPSNRLLFAHEEVVNSFLDVPRKFGRGRMEVMHLGNEHLATHGGTTAMPGQWAENGHAYKMQNDWGMIGDIAEDTPKVYVLKVSSLLGERPIAKAKKAAAPAQKLSERAADPFESYAISLLKKGEPIVRWERDGSMRAVGAIRSTGACLRCHESKEGDLLGAFTYDFGKTAAPEPTAEQKQVLQGIQEGKTLEQVARLIEGSQKQEGKAAPEYWQWMARTRLLDAGIVTTESVNEQAKRRQYLLTWIQSSFNRPTAAAKN